MNGNYQSSMASGKKGWMWPVIVLVVIVVLLAAYYVFYYGYTPASGGAAGEVSADDIAALEQNLQGITTEGLGSELGDIEKELAQ